MVEVRQARREDCNKLAPFFMSLSDETVTLMNHFGKVNEQQPAEITAEYLFEIDRHECYWVATQEYNAPTSDKIIAEWGSILGLSWLIFSDKPTQRYTCSLGMMVADAYQGQGIGKQLMEAMIAHARENGMRKIYLQVYAHNSKAQNLYYGFGFHYEGVFVNQEWDGDKPLHVMSMGLLLENSNLEWCEPK